MEVQCKAFLKLELHQKKKKKKKQGGSWGIISKETQRKLQSTRRAYIVSKVPI